MAAGRARDGAAKYFRPMPTDIVPRVGHIPFLPARLGAPTQTLGSILGGTILVPYIFHTSFDLQNGLEFSVAGAGSDDE